MCKICVIFITKKNSFSSILHNFFISVLAQLAITKTRTGLLQWCMYLLYVTLYWSPQLSAVLIDVVSLFMWRKFQVVLQLAHCRLDLPMLGYLLARHKSHVLLYKRFTTKFRSSWMEVIWIARYKFQTIHFALFWRKKQRVYRFKGVLGWFSFMLSF